MRLLHPEMFQHTYLLVLSCHCWFWVQHNSLKNLMSFHTAGLYRNRLPSILVKSIKISFIAEYHRNSSRKAYMSFFLLSLYITQPHALHFRFQGLEIWLSNESQHAGLRYPHCVPTYPYPSQSLLIVKAGTQFRTYSMINLLSVFGRSFIVAQTATRFISIIISSAAIL